MNKSYYILAVLLIVMLGFLGCGIPSNSTEVHNHPPSYASSTTHDPVKTETQHDNQKISITYTISPIQMLIDVFNTQWLNLTATVQPLYVSLYGTATTTTLCLDTQLDQKYITAVMDSLNINDATLSGFSTISVCKHLNRDMYGVISSLRGNKAISMAGKVVSSLDRYIGDSVGQREFVVDLVGGKVAYLISLVDSKVDEGTMRGIITQVVKETFSKEIGKEMIFKDTNIDGSTNLYYQDNIGGIPYMFSVEDENGDGLYDTLLFYIYTKGK